MLKKIRKKYSVSDLVIYGVFGALALWALITLFINPFSYIFGLTILGLGGLHTITFLCLTFMFLWFWRKMAITPIHARFLVALIFCWIGYFNYDFFWHIDYYLFGMIGFPMGVFLQKLVFAYVIPMSIFLGIKRFQINYSIPTIRFKRFILVLIFNFIMILWLESTGFFIQYWNYTFGIGPNPHSWVWLIGKSAGTLSMIFTIKKERN
mgnify:CR=1 FL=1